MDVHSVSAYFLRGAVPYMAMTMFELAMFT